MRIALFLLGASIVGLKGPILAQRLETRDSLGVRIVQNPSRVDSPIGFRLAPNAGLTLGGLLEDPRLEFDQRNGYLQAALLSDGRLVVIDRDRLHWIDSAGKRVLSVGRAGDGPGEFRSITTICVTRADTIVVWDDGNHRLGIYSPKGQFIRNIPLAANSPPRQGCLADGHVLLVGLAFAPDDPRQPMLAGRIIDLRGNSLARTLTFDPGSLDAVNRIATQIGVGNQIIVADGIRSEYRVYSLDGNLSMIVRTRDEGKEITASEYGRLVDRMVPAQPKAKEIKARLKAQRHSTHWPTLGAVLADPVGCVWMQDYKIPEHSATSESWVGFSRDGRMLGRLLLPRPQGIARRELVTVEKGVAQVRDRDMEGVTYLRFVRIIPLRSNSLCN